ncbi:prolyl oligopeptidase family serine peptidase [Marilutibacter aestuarii]|uniref:Prolyl oligopeptidase family serine peptidase n=1 Tax=Marilutibacter aestuarii TaxID=1706195 RepID=A0A508AEM4_9GAMM|nr:prolyl oligopeptidase family serine peptidase [Lysobacter aestuarii]TQD48319.1 prolyl oligopeptidase family serine peptidase [Lysobacter aestuarii]
MDRPGIARRLAAAFATVLVLSGCAGLRPATDSGFVTRTLEIDGTRRAYQVFVPSASARRGPAPVILFLHGSGERGDDGRKPTLVGLGPYVRAHAADFPAIVVFPQVPDGQEWQGANVRAALAALDAATREFDGDRERTYLTGLSMGGYGVWEIALAEPERFAALVPVCGAVRRIRPERDLQVTAVADEADPYAAIATRLSSVPVWIFHGAKDDVVPTHDDRMLARAFDEVSTADARYTEFPDADHNAWDATYAGTPALWPWLFAQRLEPNEADDSAGAAGTLP